MRLRDALKLTLQDHIKVDRGICMEICPVLGLKVIEKGHENPFVEIKIGLHPDGYDYVTHWDVEGKVLP